MGTWDWGILARRFSGGYGFRLGVGVGFDGISIFRGLAGGLQGFEAIDEDQDGAAEAWLRADLVRMLRRKPEQFTVGRPVHALATRVRCA